MSEALAVEAPATTEIALIDLSSIAHPVWHMCSSEPDPDYTSRQIVARVRSLTRHYPQAAICCDSGKSFRREVSPTYKANRPPAEAALFHQIDLAKQQLVADGYPVWAVKGFEADDLIATAVSIALGIADTSVVVVSADKDLLQLVGPRVRVLSPRDNQTLDAAGVFAKLGVRPEQVRDYLVLVGDAADNVKGAEGIGPKKAADLLARYGSIESVYNNLKTHGTQFKSAMATALRELEARLPEVRELITLRTDVDIPFAELDNARIAKALPPLLDEGEDMSEVLQSENGNGNGAAVVEAPAAPAVVVEASAPAVVAAVERKPAAPVAAAPAETLPVVLEYGKQLEPRSLSEAMKLANALYQSALFGGAYGSPHAVLSTIIAGRELGLQTMAALRAFHIVEGKHQLSADFIRALVLKSGLAEYFRVKVRNAERCTFITKRKGDDDPIDLTYTIDDARQAGLVKDKSGWAKNPADMLVARAGAKLARLVYPEVVFGLYAPEEFDE